MSSCCACNALHPTGEKSAISGNVEAPGLNKTEVKPEMAGGEKEEYEELKTEEYTYSFDPDYEEQ